MSARYYVPWLARWVSSDPINSEVYNWEKGNSNRNQERDFIELCATPYEYAYDNPINFNDPSGEQPPKEKVSAYTNPDIKKLKQVLSQTRKSSMTLSNSISNIMRVLE